MQAFNLDLIPAELRARPQWTGFRVRAGKKIPCITDCPRRRAKSNDPATWREYTAALDGLKRGNFDAIAYALAGDYTVVDLDNCLAGETLSELARQYVEACASYTETSISGRGLHIVLRGQCRSRKGNGVEVYSDKRFIIFTGNALDGETTTLSTIRDLTPDTRALLELEGEAEDLPDNAPERTAPAAQWPITAEVESVIETTLPPAPGTRNNRVFALARALKFRPEYAGSGTGQFKAIVRAWHTRALPNILTKDFDTTWGEFCYAFPRAKHPPGFDPVSLAWQRVESGGAPDVQCDYENPKLKILLRLCAELSRMRGRVFFLTMRRAAALLDVKPMQVARWLEMAIADGHLELVKRGDQHRASRYRWREG